MPIEMEDERLDADLVRRIAALSGLQLTPEGAAELVVPLQPLFAGDADIRALRLEGTVPLGRVWSEEDGG